MSIQLTSTALSHIQEVLAKHPKGLGLRLGVKKTGCSGYGYVVDVAESIATDDTVFDQGGVKIIVNTSDLLKIDGTEIDFVNKGLNQHFEFHNPKADHYCGCGESFTLKSDNPKGE